MIRFLKKPEKTLKAEKKYSPGWMGGWVEKPFKYLSVKTDVTPTFLFCSGANPIHFLHLRTNLQTCPKARLHALIKKIFGQNFRTLYPRVLKK